MSVQNEANTTTLINRTVHFVISAAPLLSGELTDCSDAQDETCVGGTAAVAAYLRHYGTGEPSLILPFVDRDSPFVQMHPLVWNVNRLVFQDIFGFRVFTAPPSLLTQHKEDFEISQRDLSGLQSEKFPYLLTNVAVPPSITWSRFTTPVYFDDETGLAILISINDGQPMTFDQTESTLGVLDYIACLNAKNGCLGEPVYDVYEAFVNRTDRTDTRCWIPVVVFADNLERYEFAVLNGGSFPGCTGQDATFEVLMRVSPVENLNHLGLIRYLEFSLVLVAVITSLFLSGWAWYYRNLRIVKTLQPFFLMTISFGMLVMALTIIPLSIDDGTSSQRGCDIACMASPWFLSMGFTISMSALFSKLWRINKLFGATSRRMRVREVDVMAPFALLFTMNFTFMLVWTLADPLRWVRLEIAGEPWNTYGSCQSSEDGERTPISFTMSMLVGAVNVAALFVACKQAYQARNISDEFSEARNMGVGLFSWFLFQVVRYIA